jgi:dinuclear metal center YbgI/SA1388 family protein
MATVADIAAFLETFAPPRLAEEWDNVGLLVGTRAGAVKKMMVCLTITPASSAEAVDAGADLIVTHHPLPFHAVKRLTDETTAGKTLLQLIAAQIAVCSPHTAFDSTAEGINDLLARGLELQQIAALIPQTDGQGTGRWGKLDDTLPLGAIADRLKRFLKIERLQIVGDDQRSVQTVAIGCGAADELLSAAMNKNCDVMVLGEARFHTCLEAEAANVALLLPGHFASERFAVEQLALRLAREFPTVEVWASRREADPLSWR